VARLVTQPFYCREKQRLAQLIFFFFVRKGDAKAIDLLKIALVSAGVPLTRKTQSPMPSMP